MKNFSGWILAAALVALAAMPAEAGRFRCASCSTSSSAAPVPVATYRGRVTYYAAPVVVPVAPAPTAPAVAPRYVCEGGRCRLVGPSYASTTVPVPPAVKPAATAPPAAKVDTGPPSPERPQTGPPSPGK